METYFQIEARTVGTVGREELHASESTVAAGAGWRIDRACGGFKRSPYDLAHLIVRVEDGKTGAVKVFAALGILELLGVAGYKTRALRLGTRRLWQVTDEVIEAAEHQTN